MHTLLRHWWHCLIDLFLPTRCIACNERIEAGGTWCPLCAGALISGTEAACPRCGVVWLEPPPGGQLHVCGPCLKSPPSYRRARALYAYGGPVRDAITAWKNRPDETVGRALGAELAAGLARLKLPAPTASTRVVAIPSARRAWRHRGFNPAQDLARVLAHALHVRFTSQALEFTRVAPAKWWQGMLGKAERAPLPSRGLSRAQRLTRMTGMFQANRKSLEHCDVILVDDVMTTGATVEAASQACLAAGARSVEVVAIARVPHHV